jgi:hypothetical protein
MKAGKVVRSRIRAAGLSFARVFVATVAMGPVSGQQLIEPDTGRVLPNADAISLTEISACR